MLIFKSFFRKKTTKVYLTLFSLLLFSIILLLSFKEYYVSLLKENYKESYLGLVADKKEINKLTDLNISYEPITKGRKVVKIKFIIQYKDIMERLAAEQTVNNELDQE